MKMIDKIITSLNLKKNITTNNEKSIAESRKIKIMPTILNIYKNKDFNSSYYGNPFPFDWYSPDNLAIKI